MGRHRGKKFLDTGCGSGHSILYCAQHRAEELWDLDLSARQIHNAQKLLSDSSLCANLFVSPMEENPGIPIGYFDVV